MECPKCKGNSVYKFGTVFRKSGRVQRFQCRDCGKIFLLNSAKLRYIDISHDFYEKLISTQKQMGFPDLESLLVAMMNESTAPNRCTKCGWIGKLLDCVLNDNKDIVCPQCKELNTIKPIDINDPDTIEQVNKLLSAGSLKKCNKHNTLFLGFESCPECLKENK